MNENKSVKRGLVLAGGGAKGAFAFGVMQCLISQGIEIHAVSGTSVGALNAALFSTGEMSKGETIWKTLERDRVYPWRFPVLLSILLLPPIILAHFLIAARRGLLQNENLQVLATWFVSLVMTALPFPIVFVVGFALSETGIVNLDQNLPFILMGTVFALVYSLLLTQTLLKRIDVGPWLGIRLLLFAAPCVAWGWYGPPEQGTAELGGYKVPIITALPVTGIALVFLSDLFCGYLSRWSVMTSEPLARTIADISSSKFRLPTYVTVAASRYWTVPRRGLIADSTDNSASAGMRKPLSPFALWGAKWLDPLCLNPSASKIWIPIYRNMQQCDPSSRTLALLASAALPYGIVPSVRIEGESVVDGGVADNLPLLPMILKEKCDELIVVCLSPLSGSASDVESSLKNDCIGVLMMQRFARLSEYIRRRWREEGDRLGFWQFAVVRYRCRAHAIVNRRWPKRLILIAPSSKLGGKWPGADFLCGTMNFNSGFALRIMKLGEQAATEALSMMHETEGPAV